jgi:hypothetical protein
VRRRDGCGRDELRRTADGDDNGHTIEKQIEEPAVGFAFEVVVVWSDGAPYERELKWNAHVQTRDLDREAAGEIQAGIGG